MSDIQSSTDTSTPTPPPNRQTGTNPVRLTILLLIFGLALAGLLYDYCVARPAHKDAYDKIMAMLAGTAPDPNGDGTFSDDEVQEVLGFKPSSVESRSDGKTEIYTWRSGLPYRTYDLFVVYEGQKMPLLFSASTERPGPNDLPKKVKHVKPTQKEIDDYVPMNPGVGQAMGGGGSSKRPEVQHPAQKDAKVPAAKEAAKDEPAKTEPSTGSPEKTEPPKKTTAKPETPKVESPKTDAPATKTDPAAKEADG